MTVDLSKFLTVVLLIPIGILVNCYYAFFGVYLYTWFLIPLGLPVITVYHFAGILMLKSLVFNNSNGAKIDDSIKVMTNVLVVPPLIFVLGYIIRYHFMGV